MTTSAQITITEIDDQTIAVASPYEPTFVRRAKQLGGRWNPQGKTWGFGARERREVEILLGEVFGWVPPETGMAMIVEITITAQRDIEARRDGIRAGGMTIARATGRDSGARVGEGVVMLDGKINSRGSIKNWYTVISSGSTFRLSVPELAVNAISAWDWVVTYTG